MTLKEILKNEEQNRDRIYLYQEDGCWCAYEHSAFYCYSLLGIMDTGWLFLSQEEEANSMIIRIRISDIDRLINNPQLKLLSKTEFECAISCRNFCKGFHYWREEQEVKCEYSQIRNQNRKTKEMSVSKLTDIPVIKGIYDPLSQKRDGTITPCAPVLIFGSNLLCWPKDQVDFYLCPAEDLERMIPVLEVYKHTDEQLLITLPDLEKGHYHLVLQLRGETDEIYHFPVTWQVKVMTLMDIYCERQSTPCLARVN